MVHARRNYILVLALVVVTACLTVSCRKQPAKTPEALLTGKELPLDSLYLLLSPSYAEWTDAYLPMQISMSNPAQFQISGRATMLRDSLIHISLRMMGMEVGAALITSDSIWAIDKFHKMYVAESLHTLLSGMLLSIGQLQDLLLGQAFDWKSTLWDAQVWGEASTEAEPCLLALYLLAPGAQAECRYGQHQRTQPGLVAESWRLLAGTPLQKWDVEWKWQLNGAKWNTDRKISFKIGDGYRQIRADALLQALKGL